MEYFNYKGNDIVVVQTTKDNYFKAKEITKILGYTNANRVIIKSVAEEDIFSWSDIRKDIKGTKLFFKKTHIFLNTSGLYSLILKASLKNPKAIKLSHWFMTKVCPSLIGTYKVRSNKYSSEQQIAWGNKCVELFEMVALFDDDDENKKIFAFEIQKILNRIYCIDHIYN